MVPICLNIVQHKFDELVLRLLFNVLPGAIPAVFVRLGTRRWRAGTGTREDSKKVLVEDQAQNSKQQCATNADVHTPKTAESSAATALVTTIFNVLVRAAGCPLHALQ